MNEGPIPLTDDFMDSLFGGAERIQRVYHRPMPKEEKPKAKVSGDKPEEPVLNRPPIPNGPMIRPPDAPPLWVCNAKKEHKLELSYNLKGAIQKADQCHCIECMLQHYPLLTVGEPVWIGNKSFPLEVMKEIGMVGLYAPHVPVRCPCAVCGEEVSSCLEDVYESSEIVHLACLSFEDREALKRVGYTLDYLIRKKGSERDDGEGVHEEAGPVDRGGEAGAAPVGELLQGEGEAEGEGLQEGAGGGGERPLGSRLHDDPEAPEDHEGGDAAALHAAEGEDSTDG